jgi:hypothetical protein
MKSKRTAQCMVILATLLTLTPAVLAQDRRGTPEQRAACTPDAFRICGSYIPDPTKVQRCLSLNKSDLSDACRSVFEQSAGPLAVRK